jgi:hypothetical protein
MQPALSIVIPVLGDFDRFEQGLVSILENRPSGAEILAVFNTPYADPFALGDEIRMISAPRGASRVACLNLGREQARADIVHVLPAGAEVAAGWTDAARRRLAAHAVAAVAPLVVDLDNRQAILSAGIDYHRGGRRVERGRGLRHAETRRITDRPLGCSLTCGFWRRDALDHVGGWATDLGDRGADVDLALRLGAAGFQALFEPLSIVAAPNCGPVDSALRAGWHAERLFWRHMSVRRPLDLVRHAALVAGEALTIPWQPTRLWRLLGRMAGVVEAPWPRRPAVRQVAPSPTSDDIGRSARRAA